MILFLCFGFALALRNGIIKSFELKDLHTFKYYQNPAGNQASFTPSINSIRFHD